MRTARWSSTPGVGRRSSRRPRPWPRSSVPSTSRWWTHSPASRTRPRCTTAPRPPLETSGPHGAWRLLRRMGVRALPRAFRGRRAYGADAGPSRAWRDRSALGRSRRFNGRLCAGHRRIGPPSGHASGAGRSLHGRSCCGHGGRQGQDRCARAAGALAAVGHRRRVSGRSWLGRGALCARSFLGPGDRARPACRCGRRSA